MNALSTVGLTKRFAGVTAVDRVDLEVSAGQRHAIIGPNGAGKSTLFAMIAGTLRPSVGRVHVGGVDVTGWRPHRIARLGVSRTFQHSARFGEETLLDNCLLAVHATARRPFDRLGRNAAMRRVARDALAAVGLDDRSADSAAALSHGEARQLEIAMALAQQPAMLLADEPLAGLAEAERLRVGNLLRDLDRSVTVVLIEHDLEFVLDVADEVTVLDFGTVIARGEPAAIRANERVATVYLGDRTTGATAAASARAGGRVELRTAGLRAGYGGATVLGGVDLEAAQGRVLAVLGRNGMGKTTLLQTIMGAVAATAGAIELDGRDVTRMRAAQRARTGLALVPQGRGILPRLTVAEHLLVGQRPGRWSATRVYDLFPVLHDRRNQLATTLSGGEQQMLAIGRALLRNPTVLLLDEPSEGLAPLLVRRVGEIVRQLAAEGETIVLAEQNVRMALSVADDVAIIDRGRIIHRGPAGQLRDDPIRQQQLLGL